VVNGVARPTGGQSAVKSSRKYQFVLILSSAPIKRGDRIEWLPDRRHLTTFQRSYDG
jgi:hypothetical protein